MRTETGRKTGTIGYSSDRARRAIGRAVTESDRRSHPEYVRPGTPIRVGLILAVKKHPKADHLWIAQVDIPQEVTAPAGYQTRRSGPDTQFSIVFGGERELQRGDLVPVAFPGTVLPNGEKVRERNWRGERSAAMLLSSDEMGWTIGGPNEVLVLDPWVSPDAGQRLDATNPNIYGFAWSYSYYLRKINSSAICCFPGAHSINTTRRKGSPTVTYRTDTLPNGHQRMIIG